MSHARTNDSLAFGFTKGRFLSKTDAAPLQLPAELCRKALDALCDAFVSVDSEGNLTGFNSGFLQLTGGDASSASVNLLFPAGFRPLDFYRWRDGQVVRECSLSSGAGTLRARIVYTRSANGILAAIRLIDPEGEPARRMNAILEATDSVIVVLDRQGRFKHLNRAARVLTGYSAGETLDMPFWEVALFEDDIEEARAEFARLLEGETHVSRFENRWKMKDGSARLLSWSNSAICGPDGKVDHVVATALDLTSARLNESALASLSSDFIDAQSAGRQNVSRYLHDTVSQYLVVLALTLGQFQHEPDRAHAFEIAPALEIVDRCCRDLRVISYALAPPVFEDAGPAAVFDWYTSQLREDAGIDVEFHSDAGMKQISPDVRKLLLAAMQEWAEKTIRARMAGKTRIQLSTLDSGVRLELSSDQPENEAVNAVAASRVIRERVRTLGGTLEIASRQPGVSVAISIGAV